MRDPRVMWAYWVACGLTVVGAVAPLVTSAGTHTRFAGVAVPFGVAAVAFAVSALMYQHGRPLAVALYFIAGMAIVYGILAMVAIPIRLAVVGTCPPSPLQCPVGFEPALTDGENSGFDVAIFCGILAVFVGFYGLLVLFRRRSMAARKQMATWPAEAPTKTVAPAESEPAATSPAPSSPSPEQSRSVADAEVAGEPKELPAPVEPLELPPPV
jgi:hypothetical protein